MNKSKGHTLVKAYRIGDVLAAILAWGAFFIIRKWIEIPKEYFDWGQIWNDSMLYISTLVIPVFWLIIYYTFDVYNRVLRQSRISMLIRTLWLTVLGALILLFTILVDDDVLVYQSYVRSFVILVGLHFGLTSISRFSILNIAKSRIKSGNLTFPTLLIESHKKERKEEQWLRNTQGYDIIVTTSNYQWLLDNEGEKIRSFVENESITNVLLTGDIPINVLKNLLDEFSLYQDKLDIQVTPEIYRSMHAWMNVQSDPNASWLTVKYHQMPRWERVVKRIMDVVVCDFLLLVLLPLILFIIYKVRISSEGPILFRQNRIGKNGQPFKILKFRSMYMGAEDSGPQLSYEGDQRCTPWGAHMRKWRLDEIPQLLNVLKGDMSLVGPRPERQHFIDKIKIIEPNYRKLKSVKPGITSLGQVKYGYASDVSEMVQRLRYDLIYLDNRSLALDIKILFYTFQVLLRGTGK